MDDELLVARPLTAKDLAGRAGFDENFLGQPVPMPALPGVETVLLPYTHFSVLMRPDKRLAAVTGLGMDGSKLMDLGRAGIPWRLDPRLASDLQTGERVYARNDIDRGRLVRRASAVWGDTVAEAKLANEDTFHYTNAAPQAAKFNQGLELWLGPGVLPAGACRRVPRQDCRLHRADFQRPRSRVSGRGDPVALLQGRRVHPPGRAGGRRIRGGPDA